MRTVTAREANQQFAKVLALAERGEAVTITRRGVPVARLVPVDAGATRAERAAAIARMRELLARGLDLGGNAWPGRRALYDEALGVAPCPE